MSFIICRLQKCLLMFLTFVRMMNLCQTLMMPWKKVNYFICTFTVHLLFIDIYLFSSYFWSYQKIFIIEIILRNVHLNGATLKIDFELSEEAQSSIVNRINAQLDCVSSLVLIFFSSWALCIPSKLSSFVCVWLFLFLVFILFLS